MAKVPLGQLEICGLPKGWPAPPFLMNDAVSILNNRILVMERSVDAWRGVTFSIAQGVVVDFIAEDHDCALQNTRGKRFYPWTHNVDQTNGESRDFVTHRQALRLTALQNGATPEAIRLLHADQAFTNKEVKTMADKKAEKLSKKAAPAKAAATDKPKRAGNPEALAKARAARADAGPDVRKITILKKDNPYREGSGRAESFNALLKAKSVQDYKDAGGKVKYIARWAEEGFIKLS